jgi:hypothetical protein
MLTNQGLRALFRERFWKGVFPVPVGPGISVLLQSSLSVFDQTVEVCNERICKEPT